MFDDEADLLPQGYWDGPEDNAPAIETVLTYRLREDTSQ